MKRWLLGLGTVGSAVWLTSCGHGQSTLSPHSRPASDIRTLWWWMLGAAAIVFAGAVAMLAMSWFRRDQPGLPFFGRSEQASTRLVIAFGIVVPALVLIALFAISDLYVIGQTEAPAEGSTAMTVRVVGHQWFWEVRYPGTAAVTANEIHIPARTRVEVVATTADVIHSFWVPELNRKIDMIPGRPNRTLLYADRPGIYRGQCAEFCGLQHAHMAMRVFAQPPAEFHRWLSNMAKPAAAPSTALARRGEEEFMSSQCASCHTIRGTPAQGSVGPDLTHLATRTTLAADTIPNSHYWLKRWISDPQGIKPGNLMPSLRLKTGELRSIVAYLRGLR